MSFWNRPKKNMEILIYKNICIDFFYTSIIGIAVKMNDFW